MARDHFLREGHGTGRGQPHIEVPRPDKGEGIVGIAQAPAQAAGKGERRANGTFAKGARTVQSQGGAALKEATKLARQLELLKPGMKVDATFAPYLRAAKHFRRTYTSSLAVNVGNGICGPGPSSMVATGALQLAASRFVSDLAARRPSLKLFAEASRLADASRQSLLAAHSLCALEAKSRPAGAGALPPWMQLVEAEPDEQEKP